MKICSEPTGRDGCGEGADPERDRLPTGLIPSLVLPDQGRPRQLKRRRLHIRYRLGSSGSVWPARENVITLPYFSVSSAMRMPKSAGPHPRGRKRCRRMRGGHPPSTLVFASIFDVSAIQPTALPTRRIPRWFRSIPNSSQLIALTDPDPEAARRFKSHSTWPTVAAASMIPSAAVLACNLPLGPSVEREAGPPDRAPAQRPTGQLLDGSTPIAAQAAALIR
jgi:hypothetical protein